MRFAVVNISLPKAGPICIIEQVHSYFTFLINEPFRTSDTTPLATNYAPKLTSATQSSSVVKLEIRNVFNFTRSRFTKLLLL